MNRAAPQPVVLITGAAGNIGSALVEALAPDYTVVGLDPPGASAAIPLIPVDLASDYFDFTGDESP
jgi:nucleoside-diphosphate-sugar epimerase